MTPEEKILDDCCKRNMIKWQLPVFKLSHPRLFKSIMEAMTLVKPLPKSEEIIVSDPKWVDREPGYYWVKYKGELEIGQFFGIEEGWDLLDYLEGEEKHITEIGQRIHKPK